MRTLQSVESHSVGCAMRTLHLLVANNRDFYKKKDGLQPNTVHLTFFVIALRESNRRDYDTSRLSQVRAEQLSS